MPQAPETGELEPNASTEKTPGKQTSLQGKSAPRKQTYRRPKYPAS
jgi:hypothetical protein